MRELNEEEKRLLAKISRKHSSERLRQCIRAYIAEVRLREAVMRG